MTGRPSSKRTSLCLLALLLSCLSSDNLLLVAGDPEPIPSELLYSESFINNAENLILLNKLKQMNEERKDMEERVKALDEMQMMIHSVLQTSKTKTRPGDFPLEEPPRLRVPNNPGNERPSGKRTAVSYMTLCHFKICNMGRKRQLHY